MFRHAKRIWLILAAFLWVMLFLVSCQGVGTSATASNGMSVQVQPGTCAFSDPEAQRICLERAAEDVSATLSAVAQQTAVAEQATQSALYAEGTRVAAEGTRVAAEETRVANQATMEAVAFAEAATREAVTSAAEDEQVAAAATRAIITENTNAHLETLRRDQENMATAQAYAVVAEATRMAIENEGTRIRQQALGTLINIGLVLFAIGSGGLMLLAFVALYKRYGKEPVTIVIDAYGRPMLGHDGEMLAYKGANLIQGNTPATKALPASTSSSNDDDNDGDGDGESSIGTLSAAYQEGQGKGLTTPNWGRMQASLQRQLRRNGDIRSIPLGVDREGKIFALDRNIDPHVLVAGKTGSGKSSVAKALLAALAVAGVRVLIVNDKGADFRVFDEISATTRVDIGRDDDVAPRMVRLLNSLVDETVRRDSVLVKYGVEAWYKLPPEANESGEIVVFIDEFLSVIREAERVVKDSSREKDVKELYASLEYQMWTRLERLTNEARKYGIFMLVTMTDPSMSVLKNGDTIRRQMFPVGFNMSQALSRSFLDSPRGFPNGAAGMERGRFLVNVNGHGVLLAGFYPSDEDVRALLTTNMRRVSYLPKGVADTLDDLANTKRPNAMHTGSTSAQVQDVLQMEGRIREVKQYLVANPHASRFAVAKHLFSEQLGDSSRPNAHHYKIGDTTLAAIGRYGRLFGISEAVQAAARELANQSSDIDDDLLDNLEKKLGFDSNTSNVNYQLNTIVLA